MILPKSSVNSEKISLTVKGLLLALVPIVVVVAGQAGFDLTENDLLELSNNAIAAVSALLVLYGGLRRLWKKVIEPRL